MTMAKRSRMYFGLITGSQNNNLEGGVLRRNMSNFGSEINPDTGQFRTNVNGIANTISRLRMIGGNYNGTTTDNLNSDTNWNWNNGTGGCPAPNVSAPLANGELQDVGQSAGRNDVREHALLRWRRSADSAVQHRRQRLWHDRRNHDGSDQGDLEGSLRARLPTGGGFLACSRPFQTIISDINPSYDGDLPGSAFTGAITTTSTTPTTISGFNASSEGQAIWNAEFGAASRSVFIGDVNNVTDGAPTAKNAHQFRQYSRTFARRANQGRHLLFGQRGAIRTRDRPQ